MNAPTNTAPASAGAAARWLLDELTRRQRGRVVLLGHSYGGAIAIEAALSRRPTDPEIAGLVLAATGARLRVHPALLNLAQAAADSGQPMSGAPLLFRPGTDPALVDAFVTASAQIPPETTLADWRATNTFDRMADLGELQVPTLVLCGDEDRLTPPKYARYLADRLPAARYIEITDAGHMLPVERAAEVAAHVADFMASLGELPAGY